MPDRSVMMQPDLSELGTEPALPGVVHEDEFVPQGTITDGNHQERSDEQSERFCGREGTGESESCEQEGSQHSDHHQHRFLNGIGSVQGKIFIPVHDLLLNKGTCYYNRARDYLSLLYHKADSLSMDIHGSMEPLFLP